MWKLISRRIHAFHVAGASSIAGCKGFDICFGGRRKFCKADYSDLGMKIYLEISADLCVAFSTT